MHAIQGVNTARGRMTSHADVVARGMGSPGVRVIDGLFNTYKIDTMSTYYGDVVHPGSLLSVEQAIRGILEAQVPTVINHSHTG